MLPAVAAALLGWAQATQPSTPAERVPLNSASVSGTVTAAGGATPIARARVVLSSPGVAAPRVTMTDESGRYRVDRLGAGLYMVAVSRNGFVDATFPAPIEVAERQQLQHVDIALEPAAVIRGRILDEDGTPFAGAIVQALRVSSESGQRSLAAAATATSDDEGRFSLFGLPAGNYLVSAMDPAFARAGDDRGALNYGPTYYPGVGTPESATPVRAAIPAAPGTQRVEFRLQMLRPVQVAGRLLTSDRRTLVSAAVIMSRQIETGVVNRTVGDARISPDGTFTFTNVPPGRYVIRARGEAEADGTPLFATFAIAVQGRDVSGLEMTLTPGAVIEGRVEIQPRRGSALPRSTLRVRAPLADGAAFGDTLTGTVRSDGAFRLAGLMSGSHVLMVEGLVFPWRIAEARLQGRDVTERTIDIDRDQQFRNARIVLTDTAGGVAGTVTLPPGVAPADVLVIAFPADALRRRVPLRFVRAGRLLSGGAYRVVDLVPGAYLVAAAVGVAEQDAMNPSMLERLVPIASLVTIGEGQVLRVALQAAPLPALSQR